MRYDRGVDRAVDQHDLPVIAGFLEEQAVRTFHHIGAFNHVVEARPPRVFPISCPEIGDAELPRGGRPESASGPCL